MSPERQANLGLAVNTSLQNKQTTTKVFPAVASQWQPPGPCPTQPFSLLRFSDARRPQLPQRTSLGKVTHMPSRSLKPLDATSFRIYTVSGQGGVRVGRWEEGGWELVVCVSVGEGSGTTPRCPPPENPVPNPGRLLPEICR